MGALQILGRKTQLAQGEGHVLGVTRRRGVAEERCREVRDVRAGTDARAHGHDHQRLGLASRLRARAHQGARALGVEGLDDQVGVVAAEAEGAQPRAQGSTPGLGRAGHPEG